MGPRILRRNRLYSPKSGYLEEFRQHGPGLILELATIEHCFELGIEAHELLADDEYKLRFSTSERRHRYFRAFPRRPVHALRYAWRRFVPRGVRRGVCRSAGAQPRSQPVLNCLAPPSAVSSSVGAVGGFA